MRPSLLLPSCALLGLGCGSSGGSGFSHFDGGSPTDSGVLGGDSSFGDAPVLRGDGGDGGMQGTAEVFGESPDTLYKLDPDTKAVTVVGMFQGCTNVIDIALDKDSNMYGTTYDGFYKIDRTTAACTLVALGQSYPNSLSFVPAGTLDPNVEALVGYSGDQYVRIDPQTGAMTNVGTSIGGGYSSSGDIVSVKGGGTYLTVKDTAGMCSDCLIQVDPATGSMLKMWGPLPYTDVFGLAFWAGAVYGFDNGGDLFEVDFNGAAIQTTRIPVPNAPSNLQFFGAGSTTSAPVNPNK